MNTNISSVLTFRASSIGDSLMGKYLLENIRAAHPGVRCALAVSSRAGMIRDLFAAYPWIEIVEARKSLHSLATLFKRGRNDVVVTSYTGGVFPLAPKIVARLAARTLVGYTDKSKLTRFLYTTVIPLTGRARAPRLLETDALTVLNIPVSVSHPTLTHLPQPHLLGRLGLQEKKYIVLHLFSGGDARGLSPGCKQALIDRIAQVLPRDVALVLTGSEKEGEMLKRFRIPARTHVVSTTLQELAHLIDQSVGMVSLDTGAAHIAAHLRRPLVVLASCVGVQWWSKDMYGADVPNALFTRLDVCKDGHDYSGFAKCLDAIDSDAVAKAATRML